MARCDAASSRLLAGATYFPSLLELHFEFHDLLCQLILRLWPNVDHTLLEEVDPHLEVEDELKPNVATLRGVAKHKARNSRVKGGDKWEIGRGDVSDTVKRLV